MSKKQMSKKQNITLEITSEASVRMLHDDAIDLAEFGKLEISRASHVEFNNTAQVWLVKSAKTQAVICYASTREAALSFEKRYYSPGGTGWKELAGAKQ